MEEEEPTCFSKSAIHNPQSNIGTHARLLPQGTDRLIEMDFKMKEMRKLILRIALSLLLLAFFVPSALAQSNVMPDFKMPCRQVLKLGLEKFTEAYGKKMEDYSSAGQKMAFEYYVNCKRPA